MSVAALTLRPFLQCGRARPGPHLGMEDRQRLDRVQGDQTSTRNCLCSVFRGKAIDDAEEGTQEMQRAGGDWASVPPPRVLQMLQLRPRESHLPQDLQQLSNAVEMLEFIDEPLRGREGCTRVQGNWSRPNPPLNHLAYPPQPCTLTQRLCSLPQTPNQAH